MSDTFPCVYHHTLEGLVGSSWLDCHRAIDLARKRLEEDDLLIHIVVLAHGNDPSRIASTISTLRMLSTQVQFDRVHVWLSYQGEQVPKNLKQYAHAHGIELLASSEIAGLLHTGKTENILRGLKTIYEKEFLAPEHQFVMFLDNDYLMYDAVNVHSLYIPWVMNMHEAQGVPRSHLYVKAGGLRLKFSEATKKHIESRVEMPATFIELCRESMRQSHVDSRVLDRFDALIPTGEALKATLSASEIMSLEKALDRTTRPGGRSNRGLSCYLHARRQEPFARFLSEFSFLLHGDQGTSLENWLNASLASGYGLELSFLSSAVVHAGSGVANVIGLPHAHHPKDEVDNFLLGIEMFTLLMDLLDGKKSAALPKDGWSYLSPGKLGYESVALKRQDETRFYAPLRHTLESYTKV